MCPEVGGKACRSRRLPRREELRSRSLDRCGRKISSSREEQVGCDYEAERKEEPMRGREGTESLHCLTTRRGPRDRRYRTLNVTKML